MLGLDSSLLDGPLPPAFCRAAVVLPTCIRVTFRLVPRCAWCCHHSRVLSSDVFFFLCASTRTRLRAQLVLTPVEASSWFPTAYHSLRYLFTTEQFSHRRGLVSPLFPVGDSPSPNSSQIASSFPPIPPRPLSALFALPIFDPREETQTSWMDVLYSAPPDLDAQCFVPVPHL